MNKRTALSLAISMAVSYPVSLQALGLGELHSSSQLNQPLNAKIDLLSTSAREAGQLQVNLASPDVFSRVGIDRPDYLNSLNFTPAMENGKPVIRVTSKEPITEPFLNFLLEVSWPQGQLLKEYTVLLDPPVLTQTGQTTADNTATVRAEPKASGVINRSQEAERQRQSAEQQRQRQIQLQQQQAADARDQQSAQQSEFEAQARAFLNEANAPGSQQQTAGLTKYRVKRGDNMSRIASRLRYRGVSNNQMMVAMFRANPHAFAKNNINYLKSGTVLTRPPESDVIKQSAGESRQIIKQHYTQWKKYRSGLADGTIAQTQIPQAGAAQTSPASPPSEAGSAKANLKVAGTNGDSVSSNQVSTTGSEEQKRQLTLAQEALASSKSENVELKSRLTKLEAIIRKKDRLIDLKNERLAKLEAQIATLSNGERIPEAPLESPEMMPGNVDLGEDLARQISNEAEQSSNKIIRGTEEPAEPQTAAQAAGSVSPGTQTAAVSDPDSERLSEEGDPFREVQQSEKDGLLEMLTSPLAAAIGGGSLLALILGWLLMRRSSRNEDADNYENADFEISDDENFEDDLDTGDLSAAESKNDFGFISNENQAAFDDFEQVPDTTPIPTADSDIPGAESAEASFVASDDSSDDAIDSILTGDDTINEDEILQEADVYIVYGLHEQAEEELKKAINDYPAKLEYRYKLLENYKAAGQTDNFVNEAKEFLAVDGDNKQKLWDKIAGWGQEIAPENELFSESSADKATAVLTGSAGLGAAATQQLAKEAFSEDVADEPKPDVFEAPASDELQISGVDGEDFELDLDEEDFGLDELAEDIQSSGFESGDNILSFGSPASAKTDNSAAPTGVSLEIDQDSGLDKILPAGNAYTDAENSRDDEGDDFDDALSFLDLSDDEEMQEAHIGTKLDLARAYLDMGDVEGARCTLEEVVIEGNEDQKREAEELLQQTG